ncbi:MAG TPA: PLDc N-terminal domain-containing protein [Ktedonobacterales bacterium]|nr:PLDc N-terminal domain-containing protein [Ktedonobacterales bacterium]
MPAHTGPSTSPQAAALLGLIFLFVDIAIALYFINDLYKPERRVAGGDKTIWMAIILFGSVLGWLAYLSFGRES